MLSWSFVIVVLDVIRAENPFGGSGFLVDPFLELTAGATTPAEPRSSRPESTCLSNGTLAVAILCTLLLSAFIGFLTWMIYLRQQLQGSCSLSLVQTRRPGESRLKLAFVC